MQLLKRWCIFARVDDPPPPVCDGDAKFQIYTYDTLKQAILKAEGKVVLYIAHAGAGKSSVIRCLKNSGENVEIYEICRVLPFPWELYEVGRHVGIRKLLKVLLRGGAKEWESLADIYIKDVKKENTGTTNEAGKIIVVDEFQRYFSHRNMGREVIEQKLQHLYNTSDNQHLYNTSDKMVLVSDVLVGPPMTEGADLDTSWIEYALVADWGKLLGKGVSGEKIRILRHGAVFITKKKKAGTDDGNDEEAEKYWQGIVNSGLWPKGDKVVPGEVLKGHNVGGYLLFKPPADAPGNNSGSDETIFACPALVREALDIWKELENKENRERSIMLGERTGRLGWRRLRGMGIRPLPQVVFGETYYAEVYRFIADYLKVSQKRSSERIDEISERIDEIKEIKEKMDEIKKVVRHRPDLHQEYLFWFRYVTDGWMAPVVEGWDSIVWAFRNRSAVGSFVHGLIFVVLTFLVSVSHAPDGWLSMVGFHTLFHGLITLLHWGWIWLVLWLAVWWADFHVIMNDLPLTFEDFLRKDVPGDIHLLIGWAALSAVAVALSSLLLPGGHIAQPMSWALLILGLMYLLPGIWVWFLSGRMPWNKLGYLRGGSVARSYGFLVGLLGILAHLIPFRGVHLVVSYVVSMGACVAALFWLRFELWRISMCYALWSLGRWLHPVVRGGDCTDENQRGKSGKGAT